MSKKITQFLFFDNEKNNLELQLGQSKLLRSEGFNIVLIGTIALHSGQVFIIFSPVYEKNAYRIF